MVPEKQLWGAEVETAQYARFGNGWSLLLFGTKVVRSDLTELPRHLPLPLPGQTRGNGKTDRTNRDPLLFFSSQLVSSCH